MSPEEFSRVEEDVLRIIGTYEDMTLSWIEHAYAQDKRNYEKKAKPDEYRNHRMDARSALVSLKARGFVQWDDTGRLVLCNVRITSGECSERPTAQMHAPDAGK